MVRIPFTIGLLLALLFAGGVGHADSFKLIKLKDGSTLKGRVLQLKSGVYTIATENLGDIDIQESDILSIASPSVSKETAQAGEENTQVQSSGLKQNVEELQGQLLTDPEIIQDVQTAVQDESVRMLLSDPQLLNDLQSYDQKQIEQNPNIQKLINNPKIQELMNKIQTKYPAQ